MEEGTFGNESFTYTSQKDIDTWNSYSASSSLLFPDIDEENRSNTSWHNVINKPKKLHCITEGADIGSISLDSRKSSGSDISISTSQQNCVECLSSHDEEDFVIEDCSSDGLLLSPLQLLSGMEAIDFESDIKRSPISLSIELEPFIDICCKNLKEEDDSLSPPPSRILEMISTPVDRDALEKESRKKRSVGQKSTAYPLYQFKARPAETGVFVMNQRNVVSTTPIMIPKHGSTSKQMKRESGLKQVNNLGSKTRRDQHRKQKRKRQLEPHEVDSRYLQQSFGELSCRCTKTRCLKLYCDCFQAGKVCKEFCECTDCKNTQEESGPNGVRTKVIKEILKRRPNAFQKKRKDPETSCACKSSKCLKKYCQCFVQGRFCSNSCICQNCHNRDDMNVRHLVTTQNASTISVENKKRQSKSSVFIMPRDDSSHSSSQSTSLDALDAMIESNVSFSFNPTKSEKSSLSKPNKNLAAMANVPPPEIPDIFKSALPFIDPMSSTQPSHLPHLEIPEVFRNSTSATTVPAEVFTNPNFWLKSDNWVNHKKEIGRRKSEKRTSRR